jgi:hypothetical protein
MNEMLAVLTNVNTVGGTYDIAVRSASRFLPAARMAACQSELREIDLKENQLTIEAIRDVDALSKDVEYICQELVRYDINPDRMTVEESKLMLDFASGATNEIRDSKVETIMDMITRILNGKHERRDYSFDPEKAEILENLIDKSLRYERGEIDLEKGFDYMVYPKESHEISQQEFENLISVMSVDELLDGGYIDEQDLFVHGPFTARDLEFITSFSVDTWVRATDSRNDSRLTNFFERITEKLSYSIDDDLNRNFVARAIVPQRRLSAKNMLSLVCAFALECNDKIFAKRIRRGFKDFEEYYSLLKSLQLCSYYISLVCNFRKDDLKKKWKVARPTASGFYMDTLTHIEKWEEKDEKNADNDYGAYFVRLDDHFFEAQANYTHLLSRKTSMVKEHVLLT